jgi:hypothetical protein
LTWGPLSDEKAKAYKHIKNEDIKQKRIKTPSKKKNPRLRTSKKVAETQEMMKMSSPIKKPPPPRKGDIPIPLAKGKT